MLHTLSLAGDRLGALRIHCARQDWAAAEALVSSSHDAAAGFHLARVYEAQGRVPDALRCFAAAGRHAHAARLALRCGEQRAETVVWWHSSCHSHPIQRCMPLVALLSRASPAVS
jgi:hypothetical protein